ncbi:MAG: erythromycin esterase family protein [bacterium]|nr:erythromycin esterase family protein [bacterium]
MSYRQTTSRLLTATLLILIASLQVLAQPGTTTVKTWVERSVHPLDSIQPGSAMLDLAPLDEMVGDARLALLGESRHDAHEQFLLKHRIIEYLVAEKGFTVLAMEESMPCARRLNDWVLGGPGDPAELADAMSAWFIWNTEEVLDLLMWVRTWNQDPAHQNKVSFHGLDIMDPLPAVADLTQYLTRVDPAAVDLLNSIKLDPFNDLMWPLTADNYRALTAERRQALLDGFETLHKRIADGRDAYISRSSHNEYEDHLRLGLNMKQSHEMFEVMIRDDFLETGHVRERAMAGNALWLLDERHQGEKLIIWAHNLHVARDTFDLNIPNRPPTSGMIPMGCRLGDQLGDDMVTIGFTFGRGTERDQPLPPAGPDSVDGVLASAGLPQCFIDLRLAPAGPVGDWFNTRREMRAEGGVAELVPAHAFDLLIFVDELTNTRFTSGAVERFNLMRSGDR